jgi:hypothetical protein
VALDIGDLETKQQRRDTFDAPANLNHKPLDPAPPDSSAASRNKYLPDSDLLFNRTLLQSRCIDSNLGKFVSESQEDGAHHRPSCRKFKISIYLSPWTQMIASSLLSGWYESASAAREPSI